MKRFLFFPIFVYFLLSCSEKPEPCQEGDRTCLRGLMGSHPVRKMAYWKEFIEKPIHERVAIAPKELIEYLDLDNQLNGYPNKPFAPVVSDKFLKEIKDAIREIPKSVKNKLNGKFAGVFLINDLGGTGYTESILNSKGEPIASFVVLDYQVLQKRTANEWATWKESTPFKPDGHFTIDVTIEPPESDDRKHAIQYVLLHELGHVVSVKENFHPPWGYSSDQIKDLKKFLFFNESWQFDKKSGKFISKFDSTVFPRRKEVVYYFGPKLKSEQMVDTYDALEKTNFPTLYAATRPDDDWAESFVTYVHGILMKKPFSVEIRKDGKLMKTFSLCWGTPRCEKKMAFINHFLGR